MASVYTHIYSTNSRHSPQHGPPSHRHKAGAEPASPPARDLEYPFLDMGVTGVSLPSLGDFVIAWEVLFLSATLSTSLATRFASHTVTGHGTAIRLD
jgi:hypothetical protein